MHLAPLIRDLAVILGLAGVIALVFERLRQPVVLGYLLAGVLAGPHVPPAALVLDPDGVREWADLGVIFLMFSLGLEFSFRRLLRIGRTAVLAGPFQAFLMLGLGFAVGKLVGWPTIDCAFLGAIISVSSTTIIIRTFEEQGLKKARFAGLAIGVLVAEDLAGVLIMVAFVALASPGAGSGLAVAGAGAKLILVVGSVVAVGWFTVPRLLNAIGKRTPDETLMLVTLALCLGLVVCSAHFEYSAALGAFIMGSLIAESTELHRIERILRPVRDLFAAIFFVSIGMMLDPAVVAAHWGLVLLITATTVAGKIFGTTLGVRLSGQPLAIAAQVGLSMAQIGEFSFIIAGLGLSLGVMNPLLYSLAISVSVVTTAITPYLIRLAARLEGRSPA